MLLRLAEPRAVPPVTPGRVWPGTGPAPLASGPDPGLLLTITTRPAVNCSS
jgi:hypothetical protein